MGFAFNYAIRKFAFFSWLLKAGILSPSPEPFRRWVDSEIAKIGGHAHQAVPTARAQLRQGRMTETFVLRRSLPVCRSLSVWLHPISLIRQPSGNPSCCEVPSSQDITSLPVSFPPFLFVSTELSRTRVLCPKPFPPGSLLLSPVLWLCRILIAFSPSLLSRLV